uniref:Uncharacterized protein n=1 Tax=Athene cunicularia TaxID=194338 RepID=A0A663LP81_ATHCN
VLVTVGSNESQPVEEFCSITIGDYLFAPIHFVTTALQTLPDCDFHLVSRKSSEDPSNETGLCFSGEGTSCLGKKSTVPCKPVNRHNPHLVSQVLGKKWLDQAVF